MDNIVDFMFNLESQMLNFQGQPVLENIAAFYEQKILFFLSDLFLIFHYL